MKRILSLLICLVLTILMVADCGKKKKRVRKVIKQEKAVVMKEEAATDEEVAEDQEWEEEAEKEEAYEEKAYGGGQMHTVVWGDTLGDLAYRYYRGDRTYRAIVNANPQIEDPDWIICGDKLKIP